VRFSVTLKRTTNDWEEWEEGVSFVIPHGVGERKVLDCAPELLRVPCVSPAKDSQVPARPNKVDGWEASNDQRQHTLPDQPKLLAAREGSKKEDTDVPVREKRIHPFCNGWLGATGRHQWGESGLQRRPPRTSITTDPKTF